MSGVLMDLEARVAAGVEYLDRTMPSWWIDIDTKTLDLVSCERCVLGQVVASVTDQETVVRGYYLLADGASELTGISRPNVPEAWIGKIEAQFGMDYEPMTIEEACDRGFHLGDGEDDETWHALTAIWKQIIIQRQGSR